MQKNFVVNTVLVKSPLGKTQILNHVFIHYYIHTHTHTPTHMSHATPNRVKSKTYYTCEAQNSRKNSSLEIMLKMVLKNINYFL